MNIKESSVILINLENELNLSESKNLRMKNILERKYQYFLILIGMLLKSPKRKKDFSVLSELRKFKRIQSDSLKSSIVFLKFQQKPNNPTSAVISIKLNVKITTINENISREAEMFESENHGRQFEA